MAKRAAESALVHESYRESETSPCKRIARPSTPTKLPPHSASIKALPDTGATRDGSFTAHVDSAIILQVTKYLQHTNRPGTAEAEAKAALHSASRWMGQHNASQIDVLA